MNTEQKPVVAAPSRSASLEITDAERSLYAAQEALRRGMRSLGALLEAPAPVSAELSRDILTLAGNVERIAQDVERVFFTVRFWRPMVDELERHAVKSLERSRDAAAQVNGWEAR